MPATISDDRRAIADKIQKLRNLKDCPSATPGEVANAAARIQELLFTYNLTEAQIDVHAMRDEMTSDPVDVGAKTKQRKHWKSSLLTALARTNFCEVINNDGTRNCIIVGKPGNIEVVKDLFAYLVRELPKMQRKTWDTLPYTPGNVSRDEWARSFYIGAAHIIFERLKAQQEESVQKADAVSAGSGSGLVAVNKDALREKIRELFGHVFSHRDNNSYSAHGVAAGRAAGASVNLSRRVGGGSQRALTGGR